MSTSQKPLHIDIPVKLSDVKVVFSVDALAFEGDLPASIFHMQLIKNDIAGWGATSEIVTVFHTNAGHVTLHDTAYNADRNIATGNPYKNLISDLQKRGTFTSASLTGMSMCSGFSDALMMGLLSRSDMRSCSRRGPALRASQGGKGRYTPS